VISFRYHVVSIVAVLLALAAGVALGGGPLSEIGRGGDAATNQAEERAAQLSEQLERTEGASTFQDDFATATSAGALQGAITDREVTVLAMPGADEDVVSAFGPLVQEGGGEVVATYQVQPGMVAADGKSLIDTLGAQILESVEDSGVAADATTYERMGQIVGRAVATTGDEPGADVDTVSRDILSSLRGAELLTGSSDAERRGSLVIVVLGTEQPGVEGIQNIVGGLATGVGTQSEGIVVAGSTASATDGLLGQLRDEVSFTGNVSSVDSVQTASGRVATVLGLGADLRGEPGHYGAVGIDGAVPRG
jgi:hypothetical protein